MKRYGLREDQWERIKHLLPGKEGDPGTEANRAAARSARQSIIC